ncbi:MAG TPA: DUF6328 family protein [Pseudonocardiaceae bacterium]|jgi:hypothetical protein
MTVGVGVSLIRHPASLPNISAGRRPLGSKMERDGVPELPERSAEEETMSAPQESESARLTRNFAELLQELRVAQGGIQILFGFLLTVVFTDRYQSAGRLVHGLHLTAVLLAVAATGLLTATAAWHRILFRQQRRVTIIQASSRMALGGLACLAGSMTATLTLIVDVVLDDRWALVLGGIAGLGFILLWFVTPQFLVSQDDR